MAKRATWIAVGAMVMVGTAEVRAQEAPPAPAPVQAAPGPLEPPRFVPAPVPADTVEKVKKSMTDVDPFEQEGAIPPAPAKPSAALPSLAPTGAPKAASPAETKTTAVTAEESKVTPAPAGDPKVPAPVPAPAAPTTPASDPSPAATSTTPVPVPPATPAPPAPLPRSDESRAPSLAPSAQRYDESAGGPEPGVASRAPEATRATRPGFAMQAGGGIMSYGRGSMRELTTPGGYWDARAVLGFRGVFNLEAAYIGTVTSLHAPGVVSGSRLVGQGAEGALRVNVPVVTRDGAYVMPFGLAGMGWQHHRITNGSTDGTVLAQSDDVVTMPVGGGVTIGYRHLYLDTRFTYRFTQFEDMIMANGRSNYQMNQWTFGGNFGYAF